MKVTREDSNSYIATKLFARTVGGASASDFENRLLFKWISCGESTANAEGILLRPLHDATATSRSDAE